jgi:hypothetical protein
MNIKDRKVSIITFGAINLLINDDDYVSGYKSTKSSSLVGCTGN